MLFRTLPGAPGCNKVSENEKLLVTAIIPGKRSRSGKTSNKGFSLNYSLTNQVNFDILMLHFYHSRYFILCAGCRPAAL